MGAGRDDVGGGEEYDDDGGGGSDRGGGMEVKGCRTTAWPYAAIEGERDRLRRHLVERDAEANEHSAKCDHLVVVDGNAMGKGATGYNNDDNDGDG
jgi:hypothetical protein